MSNTWPYRYTKEYGLLFIILAAGAFLRFFELGSLPIDGDNSYHAVAAKAILETGRPEMPSGLLYLRALPLLYLEALSVKVFGFSAWSLSLPNACIGTLNILLIFLLTKALWQDQKIALITSLLFAISPWAVAVARIPRMYEPLLMASLLTWILFFYWYYKQNRSIFPILLLSSLLTLSLHKVGILPLLCFLVPLFLEHQPRRQGILSAVCFAALSVAWFFLPKLTKLFFSLGY